MNIGFLVKINANGINFSFFDNSYLGIKRIFFSLEFFFNKKKIIYLNTIYAVNFMEIHQL